MDQKELFPNTSAWMKMAGHIVAKLTDHASDIRSQIVKVDEAIEKKRGEHRALAEELEDVELAVKEAMAFAAEAMSARLYRACVTESCRSRASR